MSFLGIQVSKGTYNIILWSIIIILVLLLGTFIYKFRNSNRLTMEAKQAYRIWSWSTKTIEEGHWNANKKSAANSKMSSTSRKKQVTEGDGAPSIAPGP